MDINPMILMRRNPVPKSVMQFDRDNRIFETLDALYTKIKMHNASIIELIEGVYSDAPDASLLELKRAIYNEMYPKIYKALQKSSITSLLAASPYLSQYKQLVDKLHFLEASLESFYEEEALSVRREMQTVASDFPEISNYMIAINKSIFSKLHQYLSIPVEAHKSKQRKLESTLYNVITRSAFKTSPFLDTTQVGVTKAVSPADIPGEKVYASRRHVSLNYTFLYRVAFAFLERSDLFYERGRFRLPPFSIVERDGTKYISYVGTMDDTASSKIFKAKEVTAELKINTVLEQFFIEKDIETDIVLEEFIELFKGALTYEKALKLFKKYVEIGLFTSVLNFDETSDEALIDDIVLKTRPFLDDDAHRTMADFFQKVHALSRRFVQTDAYEKRYQCYVEMSQIVDEINANYDLNFSSTYAFYEDGVLEAMQFIDADAIGAHYPQMQLLQQFTVLFDVNIRLQMEIAERFKLVYHKGYENIDDIFFSVLFETSKAMQGYWGDPFYVKQNVLSKNIQLLDRLKLEFIDAFNAAVAGCNKATLDIEPLIQGFVDRIPKPLMDMCDLSSTFFVQYNGGRMILNDLYDGHEKYKARFMNYFESYMVGDVSYLKFVEDYYKAQNYMEYQETFGFNGNAKSTSLENTCYTVGVGNRRFDAEKRTHAQEIEELFVEIDDKFKLVDKDGRSVKICHRGSLVPIAMPGYISLLLQLFSSGRMMFSYSQLNKWPETPRLTVNNIVVSRRRIKLKAFAPELIRRTGETDFEYYRRLNLYFVQNKIEKTFFVCADKNLASIKDKFLMGFKPMYVDIANPVALKTFEKEIVSKHDSAAFEALFYEEFLSNEEAHAIEYDIEIYKKEESR